MRLIHPIHHPLAVWQVELFIFSKTSQLTLWAAVKDLRLRKLSERLISYKLYENIPGIEVPGAGKSRSGTG